MNPQDLNELIHSRRSVFPKDYTGAQVDENIIRQMVENANWAPTHKLTEPWRFVIFSSDGLKKLANFQGECYRKAAIADNSFSEDRYQGMLTKPLQSSHIISIGMKRDEKKGVPEIEEVGAVFCAVQNMYLTAAAYKVGCYLSTGGITYMEEAKEFFGLGKEDKLLGFLHVGMPKGASQPGKRKPVDEKITWVRQ